MRYNQIDILSDGCLRMRMIPPFYADILAELPSILDGEIPIEGTPDFLDPEEDLFPPIYAASDPEADEDWRKYGRPDLIALFASRKEVIEQDLESLIEDFYFVPFLEGAQRLNADPGLDEDLEDLEDLEELSGEQAEGGVRDSYDECIDVDIDIDEAEGGDEEEEEEEDDDDDEEAEREFEEFRDIMGQLASPIMPLRRLLIPAANRSAWMSSLNAARLVIAKAFGFLDAMPERCFDYDPDDPEQLALLLMDALGELEHVLVEIDQAEAP